MTEDYDVEVIEDDHNNKVSAKEGTGDEDAVAVMSTSPRRPRHSKWKTWAGWLALATLWALSIFVTAHVSFENGEKQVFQLTESQVCPDYEGLNETQNAIKEILADFEAEETQLVNGTRNLQSSGCSWYSYSNRVQKCFWDGFPLDIDWAQSHSSCLSERSWVNWIGGTLVPPRKRYAEQQAQYMLRSYASTVYCQLSDPSYITGADIREGSRSCSRGYLNLVKIQLSVSARLECLLFPPAVSSAYISYAMASAYNSLDFADRAVALGAH